MKITKTRLTEIMMTQLYECSCNKTNDADGKTAGDLISLIIFCFEIISAFKDINHAQIIKRLYFSRGNIIEAGIKKMERTLYVRERTLFTGASIARLSKKSSR